MNREDFAERPAAGVVASDNFECGILEIDWSKRDFEVRGIGGHANDVMTSIEVMRALHHPCPAKVLRLAVVAWKENADGYQQLSFYDLPTFQREVSNHEQEHLGLQNPSGLTRSHHQRG